MTVAELLHRAGAIEIPSPWQQTRLRRWVASLTWRRVLEQLFTLILAIVIVFGVLELAFYRLDCGCWPWQSGESCGCFSGA